LEKAYHTSPISSWDWMRMGWDQINFSVLRVRAGGYPGTCLSPKVVCLDIILPK
jgi:hypothetical protein